MINEQQYLAHPSRRDVIVMINEQQTMLSMSFQEGHYILAQEQQAQHHLIMHISTYYYSHYGGRPYI